MINWKVRFMNRTWVVAFIAALFVLAYAIGDLIGVQLDLTNLQDNVIKVVYAIFGVLTVMGIIQDPTTEGLGDSERALTYTSPGVNEDEYDDDVEDDSEEK